MIINILVDVIVWIAALVFICGSSKILDIIAETKDNVNPDQAHFVALLASLGVVIGFIILLCAIIHVLIIKVISGHFAELDGEEQRRQFQSNITPDAIVTVSSHAFVSHPVVPTAPATAVPSDQAFCVNEKYI